jgi:hypothetical protein
MALLSLGIFLLSGAWGTFYSVWFIRKVFRLGSREIEQSFENEELELHASESNTVPDASQPGHAADIEAVQTDSPAVEPTDSPTVDSAIVEKELEVSEAL